MMLNEYQYLAKKTAIYPPVFVPVSTDKPLSEVCDQKNLNVMGLVYPALGYAGEAGEFANKVKKIIRDDRGVLSEEKRETLKGEIGDGLWYLATLATELGCNLSDIAKENLEKLASRAERGVLQGSGDNR